MVERGLRDQLHSLTALFSPTPTRFETLIGARTPDDPAARFTPFGNLAGISWFLCLACGHVDWRRQDVADACPCPATSPLHLVREDGGEPLAVCWLAPWWGPFKPHGTFSVRECSACRRLSWNAELDAEMVEQPERGVRRVTVVQAEAPRHGPYR
ncbi:hypothetical protein L6Q96_10685 [Candidatus Binatia bacterium]|nr:hypothetical protein [Candidatus Binatia bacterium]